MTAKERRKFGRKVLRHLLDFRLNRSCLYQQEKLARLQNRRRKAFMRRLESSPFYRPYLKGSWEDIPVINKHVFMDQFDAINTCSIKKEEAMEIALESERSRDFSPELHGVAVGLSSGTSGHRGLFLASLDERAKWVAAVLDRAIGIQFRKRKIAFFLRANNNLYESAKSRLLQFDFFDTTIDFDEHILRLSALQPDIVIGQPSVLIEIAKEVEKGRLEMAPEQIISVAEVLTPEDASYLSGVFKKRIEQVYQCTEGFLAHTCEEGALHFNEDFLIIERKYVDEARRRYHPIITDLFRTTQPVVRYELNDIIQEGPPCSCGRVTTRIKQIEGRADDVFRFTRPNGSEGVIFPDTIRRAVINSTHAIQEYTVRQTAPALVQFSIHSLSGEAGLQVKSALGALFQEAGWQDVTIVQESPSPIKKGEKRRRIKNESI